MATPRSQRIGIWIIAIVMTIGTIGSFAVMILANNNAQIDQKNQEQLLADYQKQQQQAAEENAAQAEPLEGYKAESFNADGVTKLQKEVLKKGDGPVLKATDAISVSYFGWLPNGKIFDSSKKSGTNTPIDLSLDQVIPGWTEGLTGATVGSTIKLVIPAEKAYGSQTSGIIPANSPLAFILTIHGLSEQDK